MKLSSLAVLVALLFAGHAVAAPADPSATPAPAATASATPAAPASLPTPQPVAKPVLPPTPGTPGAGPTPPPPSIDAKSWVLMDYASGQILAGENADAARRARPRSPR